MKKQKRSMVPPARPREPLTTKRKQAIYAYVSHRIKLGLLSAIIEDTLKAKKMKAESLYQWLHSKGYRWDASVKFWLRK